MCRIAGLVKASLHNNETEQIVAAMCRIQQHGGPDDEGMFRIPDANGWLGHRRLSIIDISSLGHQPMSYLNSRYVITYNGEIYNYLDLKQELAASGYTFSTHSDTEVIMAAYDKWGVEGFERFRGMYAFALYDQELKEILLVRGPSGIKPLYYAFTGDCFAFASEVRALKLVPGLGEERTNWPVYLMAYGHLPEPVTTLKNVLPLAKGNYIKYHIPTHSITTGCFERYSYLEKINHRKEAIELIRAQLKISVERHLISDAPIGVFLSGGLDSSIIALLAGKKQQQLLNTVSLFFEDNNYSEKKFQDELIAKLSCENHQFLLREKDFHESLPEIIRAMDLPCCDGINTWFISKYAKQSGLKAVLSGVGGDELLGGYPSFNRMRSALWLSKLPDAVLKASAFSANKKLRRLCYLSIRNPVGKYLFLRGQFIPADIAKLRNMDESEVWRILEEAPHPVDISHLTPGNQASWLETNMYMQNQLLRDADVMSMAHGLEIRVPFLDQDFMRLVMKIQSDIKYEGNLGKQLLIDAFKDVLPVSVWKRPKMGFSFPFKEWFSNNRYTLAENNGAEHPLHDKLKNGQMHWSQYFTLLLLQQYGKG